MTDVSKQILEKAHGGLKLNPDEQRCFLGTFEERVLGYADLETANDDKFQKGYVSILESLKKETQLLFVKISPQVEFDKQVFYLKQSKDADCQATIVSDDHITSPFGLVIHTNEPVQVDEKNLRLAFSNLWEEKKTETLKKSIWKKWLG